MATAEGPARGTLSKTYPQLPRQAIAGHLRKARTRAYPECSRKGGAPSGEKDPSTPFRMTRREGELHSLLAAKSAEKGAAPGDEKGSFDFVRCAHSAQDDTRFSHPVAKNGDKGGAP